MYRTMMGGVSEYLGQSIINNHEGCAEPPAAARHILRDY